MNKSVVLKNRIILYFSFLITFFIFLYLVYFLVYGQRGLLQYFYLSKQNQEYNEILAQLTSENQYMSNRIKKVTKKDKYRITLFFKITDLFIIKLTNQKLIVYVNI